MVACITPQDQLLTACSVKFMLLALAIFNPVADFAILQNIIYTLLRQGRSSLMIKLRITQI
jgi:hypothetical protein